MPRNIPVPIRPAADSRRSGSPSAHRRRARRARRASRATNSIRKNSRNGRRAPRSAGSIPGARPTGGFRSARHPALPEGGAATAIHPPPRARAMSGGSEQSPTWAQIFCSDYSSNATRVSNGWLLQRRARVRIAVSDDEPIRVRLGEIPHERWHRGSAGPSASLPVASDGEAAEQRRQQRGAQAESPPDTISAGNHEHGPEERDPAVLVLARADRDVDWIARSSGEARERIAR